MQYLAPGFNGLSLSNNPFFSVTYLKTLLKNSSSPSNFGKPKEIYSIRHCFSLFLFPSNNNFNNSFLDFTLKRFKTF